MHYACVSSIHWAKQIQGAVVGWPVAVCVCLSHQTTGANTTPTHLCIVAIIWKGICCTLCQCIRCAAFAFSENYYHHRGNPLFTRTHTHTRNDKSFFRTACHIVILNRTLPTELMPQINKNFVQCCIPTKLRNFEILIWIFSSFFFSLFFDSCERYRTNWKKIQGRARCASRIRNAIKN